jgi:predicted nuclease of restriction endonuclease-like (RecB) superfamily
MSKTVEVLKSEEYAELLKQLVSEVQSVRVVLAKRINATTNQLYWNIGKHLSERKIVEGYGKSVVERLAIDLKFEFPEYSFSARYLWEMKRFYDTYVVADEKLKQLVSVLPWGHNILLMQKTKKLDEVCFYAQLAIELGWSRSVLLNNIKANVFENQKLLPKQHNFQEVLPEHLLEQAEEALKSRYNLSFIGAAQPMKELELERRLVEKVKHFILELGTGFTFVGNQHRLILGNKEYFVDMLFFHRKLRALVAIELKIGEFKPEYIGKMGFYLSLLDQQVKMLDENPSIGIILCADKETLDVEIALQDAKHPIAVADYTLNFPESNIREMLTAELKNELNANKK